MTEEMTVPAFWSDLTGDPDALLATAEDIARINAAAIAGAGTNRRDMRNLKETYNGVSKRESLKKAYRRTRTTIWAGSGIRTGKS